MKRILLALALCALLLTGTQKAEAAEVSIDFFYTNLSGGNWIEAGDYGYCWQPEVAVTNNEWRPYADGYWAYTDVGWTWVSYEDFGWATYHYGRWARLRDHGWVWVPGYEWGPAWVSWRTGGDYVGWAPLPPRRYGYGGGEVVYEGRPIGTTVDIEFDIGPAYYNFVDVRYIGAPVLREHIYAPAQNITYIERTVNVTNIAYNNSVVYNYGPDYNRLSAYSARPIQRLTLQRDIANVATATQSSGLTRVQGDRLVVAAPAALQKPSQPVAPKVVKTKVEKPDVETGWMGVADPTAKAKIQEKMKKEDPKSVPPPQIQPRNPDAVSAAGPVGSAAPTPSIARDVAIPATQTEPMDPIGKGNDKRRGKAPARQPLEMHGSAPAQGDNIGVAPVPPDDRRGQGKRKDQPQQSGPASDAASQPPAVAAPSDGAAADPPSEMVRGPKEKKNRGRNQAQPAPVPDAPAEVQAQQPPVEGRGSSRPPRDNDRGRGRDQQKREGSDSAPPSAPAAETAQPPQNPPRESQREERRKERQAPPPQAAPQAAPAGALAAPPQQQGKPQRAKKEKKDDEQKKP